MRTAGYPRWLAAALIGALVLAAGCASSTVRSVETTDLIAGDPAMPESQLLDVGVRLFDAGIETLDEEDEIFTAPEIRRAEARFIPTVLADTLQRSGHWGAVRVAPAETGVSDVMVEGTILESTGEKLRLEISAYDASGAKWFTRRYEGLASKYSYESARGPEPFQDVYNRIANDLALHRAKLSERNVQALRTISELRFAEGFSPEAFGGYLERDKAGIYQIRRLPATNDPMLARIHRIRERDNLFVDTLQDYYGGFAKEMSGPYQDWRKESYTESIRYNELRRQGNARLAGGLIAIAAGIAGIASSGSSDSSGEYIARRTAGTVAVIGGAAMVKSGIGKREESKMHAATLKELGGSLSAEIEPQVIELDERSVTLTGTVQDQYGQWREILQGIYRAETGSI